MRALALAACLGCLGLASSTAGAPAVAADVSPSTACTPRSLDARLGTQLRRTTALALTRLAAADTGSPTRYPKAAYPGDRTWRRSTAADWTSGFYPGSLWYAYELTDDPAWAARAERWTAGLLPQARTTSHDVGFMLGSSAGQQLRLTGAAGARTAVRTAAGSLARHYVPGARVDTTWPSGDPAVVRVVVDSVMNLELLFQAARRAGASPALRDVAHANARTILASHVRPDGSTWHVADLDAATGAVLDRFSAQGLGDDTTWARGQAWAVSGLTTAWRETGDPELLAGARRVADWWVAHVPSDCVPLWDFDAPAEHGTPRDASAAAVAASGLLALARLEPDAGRAATYRGVALATLARLTSNDYTTAVTGGPSVLRREVYRNGADVGAFAWGDYYLLEALARARTVGAARPLQSRGLLASSGNGASAGDARTRTAWVGAPGATLRLDLGTAHRVSAVSVVWAEGAQRTWGVGVSTSADGRTWSTAAHWRSSGRSDAGETLRFAPRRARFVRLTADAGGARVAELRAYDS